MLSAHDRCARAGFYSRDWEFSRLHPSEILRRAVDFGLTSEEVDPGQAAGDHVMTLAAERGLDIEGSGVYPIALHAAALSDIVTTLIRALGPPWARPEDKTVGTATWVSSACLASSGLRLHRVLMVSRWSKEREKAERYSWGTLGETSVYELPQTIHVVNLGQRRDGKHHGSFSKGWLHPQGRMLRIRKRSGEGFSGRWLQAWREEQDTISRDRWIEVMREDGVLHESLFTLDCDPPPAKLASEIRLLAERKLKRIQETTSEPDMRPSQCWWPTPCQFSWSCWESHRAPSERDSFVRISNESSAAPSHRA